MRKYLPLYCMVLVLLALAPAKATMQYSNVNQENLESTLITIQRDFGDKLNIGIDAVEAFLNSLLQRSQCPSFAPLQKPQQIVCTPVKSVFIWEDAASLGSFYEVNSINFLSGKKSSFNTIRGQLELPLASTLYNLHAFSSMENGCMSALDIIIVDRDILWCSPGRAPSGKAIKNVESSAVALQLWPNPVNSYLDISYTTTQGGALQIAIHSALGQGVHWWRREGYRDAGQWQERLSLADLAPGYYWVELIVGEERWVSPFIKQ